MKDIQELRTHLHEILNALAISRGLAEGVLMSLQGQIDMTPEQKTDKLARAIKAMDRVEAATQEIRSFVHTQKPPAP